MPFTPPGSGSDNLEELWFFIIEDLWGMIKASPRCVLGDCGDFNLYRGLFRNDLRSLWDWIEKRVDYVVGLLDDWLWSFIEDLFTLLQIALDWLDVTWNSLGPQIMEGLYSAVSWAEAKATEVADWARARYDDARMWASLAWDWVSDHGTATWDWIREKSFSVWAWINDKSGIVWDWISGKAGVVWDWFLAWAFKLEIWYDNAVQALDMWRTVYMPYYMDLFDNYRNDLLELLESGTIPSIPTLMLSQIEEWLYDRWFGEPTQ